MSLEFDTVSLGEHLYIKGRIGWKGLRKDEYLENGDYRIINATALEEDGINWEDCGYITKKRFDESPDIILKERDILISKDGTIGKLGYVKELNKPSTVASGIFVVRNLNEEYIDTDFLYYYFKSPFFKWFIQSVTEGSVIPHLYQRDFTDMEFNLFDMDIQKKCSQILNNIDKKIAINKKINNNLLTISNKLYEEWFLNFEFPNDANEPYKTNNGEFYDTDLGVIPLDWEIGTLKDLIDFKNGYSFKSGDLLKNECSECYAIFKMGHIIKGGGFNPLATKSWIKKSEAPNLDKYLIKKGDLLMCMTDMKGNVALLGHTALMDVNNKYLLNQRVGLLRVSNEIGIDYPYLYLLTNHHIFLTNLRGRANSGVQVNLSTKEIKDSKIIIPSKNINQKFNNIVKPIFDIIFTNNAEILKLTKIRDTLLPKLMSGEIDVSKINCDLD